MEGMMTEGGGGIDGGGYVNGALKRPSWLDRCRLFDELIFLASWPKVVNVVW